MARQSTGTSRPGARERYLQRQREVIDTAAEVFAAQGYHATTIDDLVEACQLKRGGLYHYIGGKKDVLLSIHRRFLEPLLEEARGILEAGASPDVRLRELAHALMRTIDTYNAQVTVFLHEWRAIETEPGWEEIRTGRREFEAIIDRTLRDGQDEGLFRITDVRLSVLAFLGMMNYTYQWFDRDGRVSAEDVADTFCDIFLEGIRANARDG
jgi:AcrR family transcriptional regulator